MPEAAGHGRIPGLGGFMLVAVLAGGPSVGASAAVAESIPTVTVESTREAQQLHHDVEVFVSGAIEKSFDESLMRWNEPICPLVAGLTRPMAEFFLLRFSNLARSVHAPLDGERCRPNLYVMIAQNPSGFLKLLWRRNLRLFDTRNGVEPVKRFIETPRPIRVWYNANDMTPDNTSGSAFASVLAQSAGLGGGGGDYPVFAQPSIRGSRITHLVVRNLNNVIVVVDATQINTLNIGQLSDYISLISLAQIDLDRNIGIAPSILKLFNPDEGATPAELTDWDKALLTALYSTSQKSRMQVEEMQAAVFKQIAEQPAH